MSIFSDILSAITTKGRKLQIKMGLAKDFNDSKLDVGELGLVLDKDEVRIGLADGTTKEVGTKLNNTLTSTSTTEGLTAAKGKELKDLIDSIGSSTSGGLTLADIPIASITQDGLMTKAMVSKLSGIASGANFVQVVDSVASTSTVQAASANAVKQAYDLALQSSGGSNDTLPLAGGEMQGELVAQSNVNYSTRQVRNVTYSTSPPTNSDGQNGDMWVVYE